MNKNIIKWCVIVIVIILLVVGVIGISKAIMKKGEDKEVENKKVVETGEEYVIKGDVVHDLINDKAPYTLEEVYSLVSNPKKYFETIKNDNHKLEYELLHFYNYFSKNTPFMYAKKVKIDGKCEERKYIEVVEVGYMNYDQYEQLVAGFLEEENARRETMKKVDGYWYDGRVVGAWYDHADMMLYDHAEVVNNKCESRLSAYEWDK